MLGCQLFCAPSRSIIGWFAEYSFRVVIFKVAKDLYAGRVGLARIVPCLKVAFSRNARRLSVVALTVLFRKLTRTGSGETPWLRDFQSKLYLLRYHVETFFKISCVLRPF